MKMVLISQPYLHIQIMMFKHFWIEKPPTDDVAGGSESPPSIDQICPRTAVSFIYHWDNYTYIFNTQLINSA